MQAVRYCRTPTGGELSLPPVPLHSICLHLRSPEKYNLRIEELKLDRPLPKGSIHVVPAGIPAPVRWQGSRDMLVIFLEPSIIARVASESFEFDSKRTSLVSISIDTPCHPPQVRHPLIQSPRSPVVGVTFEMA
jgi:hypothetical protein